MELLVHPALRSARDAALTVSCQSSTRRGSSIGSSLPAYRTPTQRPSPSTSLTRSARAMRCAASALRAQRIASPRAPALGSAPRPADHRHCGWLTSPSTESGFGSASSRRTRSRSARSGASGPGRPCGTQIDAAGFAAFARPGYAKIAANFSFRPYGESRTLVSYEARTRATDAAARRAFWRYWRIASPFVGRVMRAQLAIVEREAARVHDQFALPGWRSHMIDEEPRGEFAADERNTPQGPSRHFAAGQEDLPAEDLPVGET